MSSYRKPTKDEELGAWRAIAWDLNFHRTISGDKSKVEGILKRTDAYVAAHGVSNGLKHNPEVVHQNVWGAFWTHIAGNAEQGLKKR